MATPTRGGSTLASALVLVVAFGFGLYARHQRHGIAPDGVLMHAQFLSANGLVGGGKVNIAGVTVGQIQSIRLDPKAEVAIVDFTVNPSLRLPRDTVAGIAAPDMTSDDTLTLTPGKAREILPPGATITDTRDAVSLEQQVSNYIFGSGLGGVGGG
ncbi:MlaD family protein [Acidomonas methanolica]|uniref:ABC transporter toluene tolerance protein n=1 Tax=Acidomonas methanolica NBRC 104435 TaxID=1231351 RepID=A0A023D5F6_ACIMT|nr:MlaD family protein [Acidomonas methanolica]MBU2653201.1 MCE family protein [Acidomonas methanolica]TCS32150.1 phospholipid/cholesterol/gamma-HCH transport system substrate-binding protein [Acidomonas methanolica]GAJ29372.1 ABC transporter toluene tolerance protein [Acidomonas methanolica NBRC 104435]GBQ49963.1 toluene ABC transporter periplasmic protein [Acidomonas methanolica]GEK97583.1 hypothetical protein AME01nite_00820 [Acidomonas methanolica NBRC 104435]